MNKYEMFLRSSRPRSLVDPMAQLTGREELTMFVDRVSAKFSKVLPAGTANFVGRAVAIVCWD